MSKKNPHIEENLALKKEGKKRCATCNRVKRLGLFYSRGKGRRAPNCKSCDKKRRQPSLDARRDKHYRTTYDISLSEYNRLLDGQSRRCRICAGQSRKNLAVDHNHRNGNVRGLLCQRCNGILAHFKDNPELLRNAVDYLRDDGGDARAILERDSIKAPADAGADYRTRYVVISDGESEGES